jgi:hypothetical protein
LVIYPGSRFSGIITAQGNVKEYLERNGVKYEFLINLNGIEKEFLNDKVDYEELRRFEETLEEKSLWRFIAMDSQWGDPFSKGAVNRLLLPKEADDQENILRMVSGYVNLFKKILSEFETDVVLFLIGTHSMFTPILDQICKNMNIAHLAPADVRMQNYFLLTPSSKIMFPRLKDTYNKILEGKLNIDPNPGEKCYQEMRNFLDDKKMSSYFFYSPSEEMQKRIRMSKMPLVFSSFKTLCISILQWYNARKLEKSKNQGKVPFKVNDLRYRIYYSQLGNYQSKQLYGNYIFGNYDAKQSYLYFPLISQPESATQVRENMWINQLAIIETLAKSVPHNWKVYVKEHPYNPGNRLRPPSYYKEIQSYPNVELMPIDLDSHELIKNSQMVGVVSGTSGWEAILLHDKPVIHFGNEFYEIAGLSKTCDNLLSLSRLINSEYKRINKISKEERKKRLTCLINAIIVDGFWIEDPLSFGLTSIQPKEKEMMVNSKTVAKAIKTYMDKSKKESGDPVKYLDES